MIQFTTSEGQAAYDLEVKQARASQKSRFAVAPRLSVGGLNAGDPIDLDDVCSVAASYRATASEPAWMLMNRLVRLELVLEISAAEVEARNTPPDARFIVATGRAISTSTRGIVAPGCQVFEGDFVPGRLAELVSVGWVIDRHAGGPKEAA